VLGVLLGIIILLLATPQTILTYYKRRYKGAKNQEEAAYWAYQTAIYYLHMIGINRGKQTPMHYAKAIIDPQFGTAFTRFMNMYLKVKYAKQKLTAAESELVRTFLFPFLQTVSNKTSFKKRALGFLNPFRCAGFYMLPDDNEQDV
jgi:hypothetical protein